MTENNFINGETELVNLNNNNNNSNNNYQGIELAPNNMLNENYFT